MTTTVDYVLDDGIATITMDDGKANVMSRPMIDALVAAFDRAQLDEAVVILTGRAAMFSAGYDMAVFNEPFEVIRDTIEAGGLCAERILSHPFPVVGACNGHAIAQGAFTLLGCDVRIGVTGSSRIGLNEVAIGLTIPHYGVELARHQLAPAWFDHATVTGTLYDPEQGVAAGFFHELTEPAELMGLASERARQLRQLDMTAHAGTKLRARKPALDAIRHGLATEFHPALASG